MTVSHHSLTSPSVVHLGDDLAVHQLGCGSTQLAGAVRRVDHGRLSTIQIRAPWGTDDAMVTRVQTPTCPAAA